jgi:hypothetical protein
MNIDSLAEATFNLAPGNVLRRATNEEIAVIKENLQAFNVESLPGISGLTWQKRLFPPAGPIETLPQGEWRYFVIAFEGTNQELISLELASCIASFEIEVGFTIMTTEPPAIPAGIGWHPDHLFHTVAALRYNDALFRSVTSDDIQEIMPINTQLQSCAPKTKDLVSQLQGLKGLPHQSQLRFLGYFALLESILTHQPKPDDRYDSITRQVKKKLALLDKRWARKINYSPFPGVSAERVWALMYSYRSAIAHGANPDFARELKALRTAGHALALLKDTVKGVLRQALIEPELLNDLRDC